MIQRSLVIGGAIGAVILAVLLFVFWPAPGPSPAEDALRAQIEELKKRNVELAAEAATRTEEANQLRESANVELEKVPAIRSRRRAARRDDIARRDAISQTPDDGAVDALRAQHERTRAAIRHVGTEARPAEGVGGGTQP